MQDVKLIAEQIKGGSDVTTFQQIMNLTGAAYVYKYNRGLPILEKKKAEAINKKDKTEVRLLQREIDRTKMLAEAYTAAKENKSLDFEEYLDLIFISSKGSNATESEKKKLEALTIPLRDEWIKEMESRNLPGKAVLDAALQFINK